MLPIAVRCISRSTHNAYLSTISSGRGYPRPDFLAILLATIVRSDVMSEGDNFLFAQARLYPCRGRSINASARRAHLA